jgi:hypothetical protein
LRCDGGTDVFMVNPIVRYRVKWRELPKKPRICAPD